MGRNAERDVKEAERRKNDILEAGFRLVSVYGIDKVSLQLIALEANVGIATLYNYFQTKRKLMVSICTYVWNEIWTNFLDNLGDVKLENLNAYQLIEAYISRIISIYNESPEILRFSGEFRNYISKENISDEELEALGNVVSHINEVFHEKYIMAKKDKSIRTDIPEEELYTLISSTIMVMAERYSNGLLYKINESYNYGNELASLKNMLLQWVREPKDMVG